LGIIKTMLSSMPNWNICPCQFKWMPSVCTWLRFFYQFNRNRKTLL